MLCITPMVSIKVETESSRYAPTNGQIDFNDLREQALLPTTQSVSFRHVDVADLARLSLWKRFATIGKQGSSFGSRTGANCRKQAQPCPPKCFVCNRLANGRTTGRMVPGVHFFVEALGLRRWDSNCGSLAIWIRLIQCRCSACWGLDGLLADKPMVCFTGQEPLREFRCGSLSWQGLRMVPSSL